MRSVADSLREELAARVRAMSAEQRIELAFRLGDDDLDAYMKSHGCDREHALRVLRRSRRAGRRHSAVMEALDP